MRVRASRPQEIPKASFLSELQRLHRDSRPPQIAHCSTLRGADYTPEPADKSYGSHGTSRGKALRIMELGQVRRQKALGNWCGKDTPTDARWLVPIANCQWLPSEFRHFREVEVPNLHRRHHHIEGFFAAGADWGTHRLH